MQAIILAAGMGKRLGDFTKENTKCMVKVNEVTLIERIINQLSLLNLNRIVIVIGYKGNNLKALIGEKYCGTPILYVENTNYNKTNNIYSLFLTKSYLKDDDTILIESDLIFSDEILTELVSNPYPNLAIVAKYQSWMDGTVVTLDEENNILSFISKRSFNFSDINIYYKTVNIYKFSRSFSRNKYIPFLEAYCKALGNNEYYEQVLRVISLIDQSDLKALPLKKEKWYEIDDLQDLNNAELLFTIGNKALTSYAERYGGYWRFPHLLDFCYLLNPFFPCKRLKDEMKAYFDILMSQYPSGNSVNALLAARYCGIKSDQIIAGNGTAELINHYIRLSPVKTGIILPTFEEYINRIDEALIVPFIPDNPDFFYSANDIIEFYSQQDIKQLFIINPNNPSGTILEKEELLLLINWTSENGINMLVDESFLDFADLEKQYSLLNSEFLQSNQHLVIVKSISKSYGIAGLRLGFLASGNKNLINQLKKEISVWNVNSFAEFFMQIFIKYQDDYQESCVLLRKERERFFQNLNQIPFLRAIPSSANYFLCEVIHPHNSKELCNKILSQNNILLKDCSTKAGINNKSYIRLAVRNKKDNDYLIHSLKELFKQ